MTASVGDDAVEISMSPVLDIAPVTASPVEEKLAICACLPSPINSVRARVVPPL